VPDRGTLPPTPSLHLREDRGSEAMGMDLLAAAMVLVVAGLAVCWSPE